jgi:two-component sensor histidine kinase
MLAKMSCDHLCRAAECVPDAAEQLWAIRSLAEQYAVVRQIGNHRVQAECRREILATYEKLEIRSTSTDEVREVVRQSRQKIMAISAL